MKNIIKQVRVSLENIADVVSEFRDNVCNEFNMVNSKNIIMRFRTEELVSIFNSVRTYTDLMTK